MTPLPESNSVFLIEDDLDIREAIVEILEGEGVEVNCFANGAEGLNALKSRTSYPRLILLDLMMPVMDGHEFLEKKNQDERLKSVPVVVMTADAFALQSPRRLPDVAAFINKPIDIDRLVEVVQSYVKT